jgi:hypothetical protein
MKPAKKGAQKSAKSTTATGKEPEGFMDEERAAMRERAEELKAVARRGGRANKADGENDVLAKIAEMQEPDRAMAERLHAIIKTNAPDLAPRTWYGMPVTHCIYRPTRARYARARRAVKPGFERFRAIVTPYQKGNGGALPDPSAHPD